MNMKKIVLSSMLAFAFAASQAQANTIVWGYENWLDVAPADGQVDEWGTYNLDFVAGMAGPESIGTATILGDASYGKTWYGTGVSASNITNTYKYLYVETYSILGDMKLALSGDSDADYYEVTPFVLSGDTGNPSVIFNPGPYVFDLSGWNPGTNWSSTTFQMIAEGGTGSGFTIRRVFMADYNPMEQQPPVQNPVPEPATLLLLATGLSGAVVSRKVKKAL